jgi:hypothetical protein
VALDCKHRPPCPVSTPAFQCNIRSGIDKSVSEGRMTVSDAERFLMKYNLPMSLPSRVYKGDKPKPSAIQQDLL